MENTHKEVDCTKKMSNECLQKYEWLRMRIQDSINDVTSKRRLNQQRAKLVKVTMVLFSAGATIFLGLTLVGMETYFKNIAFILSATVTSLTALEPFFNYRALWIEHEQANSRFKRLMDELNYHMIGNQAENMNSIVFDYFKNQYLIIWDDLSNAWIDERRGRTKPNDIRTELNLGDGRNLQNNATDHYTSAN